MSFLKKLFLKIYPDSEIQEFRSNAAIFKGLFNVMSSGVAIYEAVDHGRDFIFRDFNDAGCRIEKLKREDVIGKRVTEVFPGVEEFGLLDVFRRVWKTGRSEAFSLKEYSDRKISGWRENHVFKLPSGEIVAVYDNITERKRAEEIMKESTRRYHLIYDSSMIGIAFWKEGGIITEANDAFLRMTGRTREDLQRDLISWSEMTPEEAAHLDLESIKQMQETGVCEPYEREYIRKDGTHVPILIGAAKFKGEEECGVTYVIDLSARRRVSQELKDRIEEIERLNTFMVDREHRILEMKQEVNKLLAELGRPPKYGTML
jgi:PAS domain S-box-containing protein